jgi:hypothetical protein
MIALGARVINNSGMTPEQTSGLIIAEIRERLEKEEKRRAAAEQKPRW